MKNRILSKTILPSLLIVASIGHGADFYWDADGSAVGNNISGASLGGAGTWDTSSPLWWNLTNDVVWPNLLTDNAIFTGTPGAVTVSSGINTNRVSFRSDGYTLTGGNLTFGGTTPSINVGVATTAVIDSQILGSAGLNKIGRGTVFLGNATNAYTGTTTISSGSLIISNPAALGADTSAVVVSGSATRGNEGGSLVLNGLGGAINFSRNLSLQGLGPIPDRGASVLSFGNNTLSGTVTGGVGGVASRVVSINSNLTLSGTVATGGTAGIESLLGGSTNQVGANTYTLTGTLLGAGTLTKVGSGTLFHNPANVAGFTGQLRASAGSIRITSNGVLGTRTAAGTGGVLDVNGGTFEVLMDAPVVQSGAVPADANFYLRNNGGIFVDHSPTGTTTGGTLTLGQHAFEENFTFTATTRNGYNITFGAAPVQGGNANSTITSSTQGGGVLTFTGNFWSNAENTADRTMTINGSGNTLISGNILAAAAAVNHNLTKDGSGTLSITSTGATLDGNVNVTQGTLRIEDFRSINNAAGVVGRNLSLNPLSNNTGTLNIVGAAPTLADLTLQRTLTLPNLSQTSTTGAILANQGGTNGVLIANVGSMGDLAKTLTLGGANTADNTISGNLNNPTTGALSVTKNDAGTWVLSGTNGYTGATTISNGTLKIQANAAASTVVADTSAITFNAVNNNARGTLEFVGQASTNNVETLGALTPTLGAATIKLTPGSGGTASLVFNSLGTIGDAASVNIVGSDASNTVTITGTSGRVAPNFYFGGTDFAFSNAGVLRAPVYGSDAGFVTSATALTATSDNEITGSFTNGAATISTLKINGAQTLTLSATLTVQTVATTGDGGILATGGASTITGGTGITTGGSGALLIRVNGASDSLTIASPLTNGTTGGLTKSGDGTLILSGNNLQTGTTSISEGTVRLSGTGRLSGANATLTMRQGTTLDLNGVGTGTAIGQFNNNGTITNGSATTATLTVGNNNQGGTSFGIIQNGVGTLNVTKAGTGGQTWNGVSTYTGVTTIQSTGVVSTPSITNIGSPSGIGAGVATSDATNAASLVFTGASTTQAFGGLNYTGTDTVSTNRLFTFGGTAANSGARIQASGANGAAIIWSNTAPLVFGTANVAQGLTLGGGSTGDNRFNPQITDNGTGIVSVFKADGGVWHLGNTNTYTGPTSITGGTLYATDGQGLPTASNLVLSGGTFAPSGAFARSFGTGAGQFQWNNTTNAGLGGFSAGATKLTVDLGTGNVWASTPGFLSAGRLMLNTSALALAEVEIQGGFEITEDIAAVTGLSLTTAAANGTVTIVGGNTLGLTAGQTLSGNANIPAGARITQINNFTQFNISINATAAATAATDVSAGGYRVVEVGDNGNTGADFATISGVISGAGSLGKEGGGLLRLTGANTYTGQTLVRNGSVVVTSLGTSGSAGATSVGDQAAGHIDTGAIALGNGGGTGGNLVYVGLGETSDRKIRLNTTTGTNTIHASGVGALILTNVANDMVVGAAGVNKVLALRGDNVAANTITSQLSDNGPSILGITIDGNATWRLSNPANNYTGVTTLSAGALLVGSDTELSTGRIDLNNGTLITINGDRTFANPVRIVNNTTPAIVGDHSATFNSVLDLNATANNVALNNNVVDGDVVTFNNGATADGMTANRTFTVAGTGDTVINGNITTGTAFALALTKNGTGTLTLNGTGSAITGATTVNAGELIVNGSISGSTVAVNTGGLLGGSGTVGAANINATGILAPGTGGSGILNTGALTLNATSIFRLELGGTTAGTGFDQVNVTGALTAAGTLSLSLINGFTPAEGNQFLFALNDAADPVVGTFAGRPEGSTIPGFGGIDFTISYVAGDGNDIRLTAIPEPSAILSLLGGVGVLLGLRRRRN